MAAVTVNSRSDAVWGQKRVVLANVTTANTGDTYATGLKVIDAISAEAPSTTALGVGTSGGTITFNYGGGGGMTNIPVIAVGY